MSHWIFLQVRLGSTRLPGKALLELGGKPVVTLAMESLNRVGAEGRALLTDEVSAPALRSLALNCGWEVFVGDPENVLGRYTSAARFYGARIITRATGDNPLVSAPLADLAYGLREEQEADYCALTGMPLGTGVEVLLASALLAAEAASPDAYEREHVAPYLYHRPEQFRILRAPAPGLYQGDLRLTLDTPEDYQFLKGLFSDLYGGKPLEIPEVLNWAHRK